MTLKNAVKKALPAGDTARTLPFGIGRGLSLTINLRAGQISTYLGFYEMELNRHLRRLCPRGARSFDLGGHIGYDALILAKLSGSEVLSVESAPEYGAIIRENLRVNPRFENRVRIVDGYVGSGSEMPEPVGGLVTVDQLASDYFVPDFIKMDIEGGEVAALQGASRTLDERRPNLLVEVHSLALEHECLEILLSHGYEPSLVDQRRHLRDHRPTAHNRWIVAAGKPGLSVESVS